MPNLWSTAVLSLLLGLAACPVARAASDIKTVQVQWNHIVAVSTSTPTLQVVVNPMLLPGAPLQEPAFRALHNLGADYVRYVPWLPYPRLAVAELEPPTDHQTFWDFSHIDPMLDGFMQATAGHSVILNFSTIPAWMFRTGKPVTYPRNPAQVDWDYEQGTELRDPSMQEVAQYYARLLGWYTQGGFRDELGQWHASGHHFKVAYWEILNEVEVPNIFRSLATVYYLLDSRVLLWTLVDPDRVPGPMRRTIEDTRKRVWFSAASLWEIAIKHSLDKRDLPSTHTMRFR